jgi:hypothetical protein
MSTCTDAQNKHFLCGFLQKKNIQKKTSQNDTHGQKKEKS